MEDIMTTLARHAKEQSERSERPEIEEQKELNVILEQIDQFLNGEKRNNPLKGLSSETLFQLLEIY